MSSTSSESNHRSRNDLVVPSKPVSATDFFVVLAHERWASGGLPRLGTTTFSLLTVRTPGLWPAVLSRREPSEEDVMEQDGESGPLVRGFAKMAEKAFSCTSPYEEPILNNWQKNRIREYTSFFRDVCFAYVSFSVIPADGIEKNCQRFIRSVATSIEQATAKSQQLSVDYFYKLNGPQAARTFKAAVQVNVREWPAGVSAAVRSASKVYRGRGHFKRFRDDDDHNAHHERWHQRGRGGDRGGDRGRGTIRGRGRGRGGRGEGQTVIVDE